MRKFFTKGVFIICFLAISFCSYSQTGGVAVNKTNAPADPSAMLDVSSTSSPFMGMLIPRMSTANRNAIASPAVGLHVFNTDCGVDEYYTGSCWIAMNQVLKTPAHITSSGSTDLCSGNTLTFSIPAVNGATNYEWIVPAGAIIISGQGTTSITVILGNRSGEVCVRAESACETSANSCTDVYISTAAPSPGNITGSTTVCANSTANIYSVSSNSSITSFNWTVPSGATITAGQGTNSISVNFGTVSGNVSVVASNSCGSSSQASLAVNVNSVAPAQPGNISGPTINVGGLVTNYYSILPVSGATSYTWSVPSGAAIVGGQGTTTIIVSFQCSASGSISVTASNGCGSSLAQSLSVSTTLAVPGPATGQTSNLGGLTGVVFSVPSVPNATSYTWSVPSGSTIVSGQNTNSISVNFGCNAGNISVSQTSVCGTSATYTLAVTTALPTPTTITGTASLNASGVMTGIAYSTPSFQYANSYTWTVPSGATIATGQGTTSITVDCPTGSATTGTIKVAYTNTCGTFNTATYSVTTAFPSPGIITGQSTDLGNLNGVVYSIPTVPNATSYNWTTSNPTNAAIASGQGTNSITVNYLCPTATYTLSVTETVCGNTSSATTKVVNTNISTPGPISGPTSVSGLTASYSIASLPNTNYYYTWTVPSGASIVSGQGTTNISVNFGCSATGTITVYAGANGCNNGGSSSLSVTTSSLAIPGSITGPTVNMGGVTGATYFIAPVTGATSYTWTVPPGATITGGQGTTSITVDFGCSAIGNITVTQTNGCGTSAAQTLAVSTTLVVPGAITGPVSLVSTSQMTGVTYTIAAVPNATSYTWTVPAGAIIVSGQGTTSIVVDCPTGSASSGNITVTQTNSCGTSTAQSLAISTTFPTPGAIAGFATNLGGRTGVTYTVAPIVNATYYNWTVPSGATITGGQGTNSITVDFTCSASGNITVDQTSVCGTSAPQTLAVSTSLAVPGAISGSTSIVSTGQMTGLTYTIVPTPGASSYNWLVPAGATIISGQGTTSIVVDCPTGSATSGTISVTQTSSCGTSAAQTLGITASFPIPGPISGPTSVAGGLAGVAYSISSVTNATSYTWSVPAGATIAGGQGTTSITVNFGCTGGNISVIQNSVCGSSAARTLAVSTTVPATGTISGPTNLVSTGTMTGLAYSIAAVPGATSYTWSVPSGATIVSGQGTTSIVVDCPTGSSTSGTIAVAYTSPCGTSPQQTLAVTTSFPTPGTITGQTVNVGGLTGVTYSISPVANATSYTWTVPSGATIASGQGTTSISVNFGCLSGNVTVIQNSLCGSSAPRTLAVSTSLPQPGTITGPATVEAAQAGVAYSITAIANATSYTWTVPSDATIASGQGTTAIVVNYGCASGNVTVVQNSICGTSTPQTKAITVNAPSLPGSISGTSSLASTGQMTGLTYSITPVAGATSYLWTVPSGATIVSGQTTNSIVVDCPTGSSTSGTMGVTYTSATCGTSPQRTLALTTSFPTPGSITGPTTGLAGFTNVTYYIAAITNATSYTWTVPSGATIASGQGTTSITVNYTCSASGNITVIQNSICGSSTAQTLAVNTNMPAPGSISGPNNTAFQANTNYTYSIPVITGVTSYTWTVPSGVTIVSGQGTASITVSAASSCSFGSGVISVTPCGSTITSITLSAVYTVGAISGPNGATLTSTTGNVYSISAITGVTSYNWTVPANAAIVSGQGTTSITVNFTPPIGTVGVITVNPCGSTSSSSLTITATQTITYSGAITTFTVPTGVTSLTIDAYGGGGGGATLSGRGARMNGSCAVTAGEVLQILVGGAGNSVYSIGGGGGTFVVRSPYNALANCLVVAGGGGGCNNSSVTTSQSVRDGQLGANGGTSSGAGGSNGSGGNQGAAATSGGGGGGFTGNGGSGTYPGGISYVNGGTSQAFGGGGGSSNAAAGGGGGGYSGGGGGYNGGTSTYSGGGGGSIINGTTITTSQTGTARNTPGQVILTW